MVRFCAFGPLGSGKTLVAVKEAYRYHLKYPSNKIYSNVPLDRAFFGDSYVPIKSARDLFSINEPCFLLLDEAWSIADSRSFQAPENKALGMLLLRSRKLDWTVALTEQWYTQVDLRIRFVTDLWILPQYYKKQTILQEDIYDLFANFISSRFYDASNFFDLYDTTQDPTTIDMEELEAEYDRRKKYSR